MPLKSLNTMTPYSSNSGKNSGVTAYEIRKNFIIVRFKRKDDYRYSYNSAGKSAVETMKELARRGRGLSTYISQNQPGFE